MIKDQKKIMWKETITYYAKWEASERHTRNRHRMLEDNEGL